MHENANLLHEPRIISRCRAVVLAGGRLSEGDTASLFGIPDGSVPALAGAAAEITRRFHGTRVDMEQLNNIKKNACSEDCAFCSQSAFYSTDVETYSLPPAQEIVDQARRAREQGSESYCLVAAWREPSPEDFEKVCGIISEINRSVGIGIECSLGFLTPEQARRLKRLGVRRYNHNLETARSKFPEICTTHTYQDRLDTLRTARDAGLELCTGGILGMGETRKQRMELAADMARIRPEEVAINILVPVPGTPMELQSPISESEVARTVAVLRFLLPHSTIKISGGREFRLSDSGRMLLLGGANGIITGGYLTMGGNSADEDAAMLEEIGLRSE